MPGCRQAADGGNAPRVLVGFYRYQMLVPPVLAAACQKWPRLGRLSWASGCRGTVGGAADFPRGPRVVYSRTGAAPKGVLVARLTASGFRLPCRVSLRLVGMLVLASGCTACRARDPLRAEKLHHYRQSLQHEGLALVG